MSKKLPKNLQAAIFDLDGTLVDTKLIAVKTITEIFKEKFDLILDKKGKNSIHGLSCSTFCQKLVKEYHLPITPEKLLKEYLKRYNPRLLKINKVLPGTKNLLKELKKRGFKIGLCSGSYRYQAKAILKNTNILKHFQVIICDEDIKEHKPSPEPYLLTAKKLKVKPEQCIAFEDSEVGVLSAKNAGIGFVTGVNIGNHHTQNLRKADKVIYTLKEFHL